MVLEKGTWGWGKGHRTGGKGMGRCLAKRGGLGETLYLPIIDNVY